MNIVVLLSHFPFPLPAVHSIDLVSLIFRNIIKFDLASHVMALEPPALFSGPHDVKYFGKLLLFYSVHCVTIIGVRYCYFASFRLADAINA